MKKKLKVQVVLPVAGQGTRLKSKTPKPFVLLNKKPLFYYALKAFEKSKLVSSIILAVHPKFVRVFEKLVKRFGFKKVCVITRGGKTRQQSVYNGLQQVDQDTDIVAVHDGARPFISTALIDQSIRLCSKKKAVILAVPVKPTIKKVNTRKDMVKKSLNREELYEAQTPQVFQKDLLIKAHNRGKKLKATDDAFLVEKAGGRVSIIQGSYENIKITTKEDLKFANILIKQRKK